MQVDIHQLKEKVSDLEQVEKTIEALIKDLEEFKSADNKKDYNLFLMRSNNQNHIVLTQFDYEKVFRKLLEEAWDTHKKITNDISSIIYPVKQSKG